MPDVEPCVVEVRLVCIRVDSSLVGEQCVEEDGRT
jgi:hypothetical protein